MKAYIPSFKAEHPTFDQVSSVLAYDAATGALTYTRTRGKKRAGEAAGDLDRHGYLRVGLFYKRYLAHRVCWLLHFGEWPTLCIDHINGVPADNRIANLRQGTLAENNQNKAASNAAGLIGAHSDGRGAFASEIKIAGRRHHLGSFATAQEAHDAYRRAKSNLHTFHSQVREYAGSVS